MEPAPSSKVEEVLEEIKVVLLMRGVTIDVAEKVLTFLRHSAFFCNNIKNREGGFESGKAAAEEADVHQRVAKKFEYMSPTELKAKLDAAKEDPLYKWVYGDDESEIPPPPKPKAVPPKAREVVISITGTVRKK